MALTDSKLNMWSTVVSLSHADGILHMSEEDFLNKFFESLKDLSEDQKKTLESELKNPQDPKVLYTKISEPKDRAELLYYARMLMWADEDFCSQEEEIFNKLRVLTLDQIDFDAVMVKVNKIAEDYKLKEEARKDARPIHRKIIDAIIFWEDLP